MMRKVHFGFDICLLHRDVCLISLDLFCAIGFHARRAPHIYNVF